MDRVKVSDREEEETGIAKVHGMLHRQGLVSTLPAVTIQVMQNKESADIVKAIEPGGLADVIRKTSRSMDSAEALE